MAAKPKQHWPIPKGWSKSGWIKRLRALAESCEELKPERAKAYREWADALEGKDRR
ncbi:MAG: hypothetical protein MI923_21515 [Phycisphaerales bacterium]|nr:hypothetical protein [Phycisphaerales bacterium]